MRNIANFLFYKPKIEIQHLAKKDFFVKEEFVLNLSTKGIFFLYVDKNKVPLDKDYLFKFNKAGKYSIQIKGIGIWGNYEETLNINVLDLPIKGIERLKTEIPLIDNNTILENVPLLETLNLKENQIKNITTNFRINNGNLVLKNNIIEKVSIEQISLHVKAPFPKNNIEIKNANFSISNAFEKSKSNLQQQLIDKYKQ